MADPAIHNPIEAGVLTGQYQYVLSHMLMLFSIAGWSYCGDYKESGLIYLAGPSVKESLGDMDVDCDGANRTAGKCSNDPSGQSQTAFKDQVQQYGISDLNANIHGYVVFGNEGSSPSFEPESVGMKPLSIMAVVCNNKLVSISISLLLPPMR